LPISGKQNISEYFQLWQIENPRIFPIIGKQKICEYSQLAANGESANMFDSRKQKIHKRFETVANKKPQTFLISKQTGNPHMTHSMRSVIRTQFILQKVCVYLC
jgi:hypothetical protein